MSFNDHQQSQVDQFIQITGFQGSQSDALEILQRHEWQLEAAILDQITDNHEYYQRLNEQSSAASRARLLGTNGVTENNELSPPASAFGSSLRSFLGNYSSTSEQPENSNINSNNNSIQEENNENNLSIKEKLESLGRKIFITIFVVPLFIIYKCIPMFLYLIFKIFGGISKVNNSFLSISKRTSYKKYDPINTAQSFIDDFHNDVIQIRFSNTRNVTTAESLHSLNNNDLESGISSEPTGPDFLVGGYTHGLYLAKKDAKWLLIYLQSDEHDDKEKFIEKILLSERFVNFTKSHEMIVWGGNVANSEAYQVANGLGATKFPFLGLMCLTRQTRSTTEGIENTTPVLSIISKIQGYHPLSKILGIFTQQINKYEPTLIGIRADIKEQEFNKLIKEHQDLAYQRSLLKDKLKKKQKQLRQSKNLNIQKLYLYLLSNFVDSDFTMIIDELLNNNEKINYSRIAIRLPEDRLIKFYDKKMNTFYLYIFIDLINQGILTRDSKIDFNKLNGVLSGFDTGRIWLPIADKESILNNTIFELNDIEEIDIKSLSKNFYRPKFNLFSSFPRIKLECSTELLIGTVNFLNPNGQLIYEPILENEEEVDEEAELDEMVRAQLG